MTKRRRGKSRRRQDDSASPREWDTAAAEREFARNKAAIEDGRTFRGRQSSG
ncbi:hypothetical protein [Streptomyces sp. NPDC021969]|uniref:hypothetical protein n=1 Tax=unclassified Streptomyces TaxID=2593676 RepID=UPI0033C0ECC8